MAGYSARTIIEKLGIRPDTVVVLRRGPAGYPGMLGPLPPGARIVTRLPTRARFVHLFARSRRDLEQEVPRAARALADDGMLWVSWPKRGAGLPTDLTEDAIRAAALPQGLVDVKVCAVDAVWSGLKLVRRKELRGAARR